jgi:hypothetical protein
MPHKTYKVCMCCGSTPANVTQLTKQHLIRPRPTSPDLTRPHPTSPDLTRPHRLGVAGCGWVWLGVAGRGWVWLGVVFSSGRHSIANRSGRYPHTSLLSGCKRNGISGFVLFKFLSLSLSVPVCVREMPHGRLCHMVLPN